MTLPTNTQNTCKLDKAKPDCSPPGYPPRRLLIIACVQRSTCTYCSIPSLASVGKMPEGGNVQGVNVLSRCIGAVNRNRRGRLCVLHYRRSSASWMNAQSLLHTGHCDHKNCGLNKKKLVVMATSLERSQPHFTSVIYV